MGLVVAPSDLNLVIYQGASLQHTWTWHYGPDEESSVPVDLTSATASDRAQTSLDTQAASLITTQTLIATHVAFV